jgi:hypothetical protein
MFRPILVISFLFVFFLCSHTAVAQLHPACPDESYFTVKGDNGVGYGWYNDATCIVANSEEKYPECPDTSYFTVIGGDGVRYGWYNDATCIVANSEEKYPECPDTSYFTVIGEDDVRYGWFDNKTCLIREVVVDDKPPIITLIGDNPLRLEVDTMYEDPGVEAIDNIDGDLTSLVVIDGVVDTLFVNNYTITYSVSDDAGNRAESTRTVIVQAAPRQPLTNTEIAETVESRVAQIRFPLDFSIMSPTFNSIDSDIVEVTYSYNQDRPGFVRIGGTVVALVNKMTGEVLKMELSQ